MERLVRRARQADCLIEDLASSALKEAGTGHDRYRREILIHRPKAVIAAALYKAAVLAGAGMEERHVERLEQILYRDGSCTLPGNIQAKSAGEFLIFQKQRVSKATESIVLEGIPGGRYNIYDKIFQLSLCSLDKLEKEQFVHKKYLKNACDYDKLSGRLVIRTRQPGDAYHPAGRKVGKMVKKLFNEVHMPLTDRESWPILWDEKGIVLVPGFGCDQRVVPDAETKRLLILCEVSEDREDGAD